MKLSEIIFGLCSLYMLGSVAYQGGSAVKNPPAMQKMWEMGVWCLGQEDMLEEGMVTHSTILVLENPKDRRAWQAIVHRVAKSRTWLKQVSTHA